MQKFYPPSSHVPSPPPSSSATLPSHWLLYYDVPHSIICIARWVELLGPQLQQSLIQSLPHIAEIGVVGITKACVRRRE